MLNSYVKTLLANNSTVFAGGGFTTVNGKPHNHLAGIADNFVLPVTMTDFTASVSNGQLQVSWITNTESNNSHFDIEISSNGNDFKRVDMMLSKALDGNSSIPLKYTFSISLDKMLLMGFGGFLTLLLLPAFKDKSGKYILGFTLIVAGLFFFNSGCTKMDLPGREVAGKKIFVRVVQVDKDGTKTMSKIAVVNVKQ